jgi:hypothetical protein
MSIYFRVDLFYKSTLNRHKIDIKSPALDQTPTTKDRAFTIVVVVGLELGSGIYDAESLISHGTQAACCVVRKENCDERLLSHFRSLQS